jgi:16S rRNA (uracil1498-N3)-methyltransferase
MAAADGARGVAQVFVADLEAPVLDDEDRSHLERSLRLRPGEWVRLADGQGGYRTARWQGGGQVEAAGEIHHEPQLSPSVTVALALVKGDRTEWAVQKLTEVGVDRIVPMVTDRTVVRWAPERAERATERLRSVVRSAAAQSRRSRLPAVDALKTFRHVVEAAGAAGVRADFGGAPPSLQHSWVLIGPEGGWSPEEADSGLPVMALGSTVLRAETAAVASGILLCALRAGLVRSG